MRAARHFSWEPTIKRQRGCAALDVRFCPKYEDSCHLLRLEKNSPPSHPSSQAFMPSPFLHRSILNSDGIWGTDTIPIEHSVGPCERRRGAFYFLLTRRWRTPLIRGALLAEASSQCTWMAWVRYCAVLHLNYSRNSSRLRTRRRMIQCQHLSVLLQRISPISPRRFKPVRVKFGSASGGAQLIATSRRIFSIT